MFELRKRLPAFLFSIISLACCAGDLFGQHDEIEDWQDAMSEVDEVLSELQELNSEIKQREEAFNQKFIGRDPFFSDRKYAIQWQKDQAEKYTEKSELENELSKRRKALDQAYTQLKNSFRHVERLKAYAEETLKKLYEPYYASFPNRDRAIATIENGLQKMLSQSGYNRMGALEKLNSIMATMTPEDFLKDKALELVGKQFGSEVQQLADQFSGPLMDKLKEKLESKSREELEEWLGKAKKGIKIYQLTNPDGSGAKIAEMGRILTALDLTIDALPSGPAKILELQKIIVETIYKQLQNFDIQVQESNIHNAFQTCALDDKWRVQRRPGDHWSMTRVGGDEGWFSDVPAEPKIQLMASADEPIFSDEDHELYWEGSRNWMKQGAWIGVHRFGTRGKSRCVQSIDLEDSDLKYAYGQIPLKTPGYSGRYELVLYSDEDTVAATSEFQIAGIDARLEVSKTHLSPEERFTVKYWISAELEEPVIAIPDPWATDEPKYFGSVALPEGERQHMGHVVLHAPKRLGRYEVVLYDVPDGDPVAFATFKVVEKTKYQSPGGIIRLTYQGSKLASDDTVIADNLLDGNGLAGRIEEDVTERMKQRIINNENRKIKNNSGELVIYLDTEVKNDANGNPELHLSVNFTDTRLNLKLDEETRNKMKPKLMAEASDLLFQLEGYRRIISPEEMSHLDDGSALLKIKDTEFRRNPFSALDLWELESKPQVFHESKTPKKN